jgi:hypothetical protein
MQPHIVDFLRHVLDNDECPEKIKEEAIELMLRELGGSEHVSGVKSQCICMPNGKWIPATSVADMNSYAIAGNKIAAIKIYRTATGQGLKDSKDFVEMYWDYLKKGEY